MLYFVKKSADSGFRSHFVALRICEDDRPTMGCFSYVLAVQGSGNQTCWPVFQKEVDYVLPL